MRFRKGQAAMEYLITYSWAFLVILSAIGVLTYFGAFNPNKYIPSSCDFGEQLKCVDYYVGSNNIHTKVIIKFRNQFEQDIRILGVENDLIDEINIDEDNPLVIPAGEIGTVQFNTTNIESIGQRVQYEMNINFSRDDDSAREHVLYGKLSSKVSDNSLDIV